MANREYLGKDLYAAWVYSGGTVTLSGEQRNFTWQPNIDFIELQAGADATRRRHEHLKDWTMTIEWTAQSDGTALITALAEGTRGTLTFGDAGTAVGRPRLVAEGMSQGITRNAPYSDIVMYSLSIVGDGAAQDAIYDWYVSNSGSDSNDGKYPTTPFLTIAKLLTVMAAGESAALAKGSTWSEQLTLPGTGCTIASYGTGNRPHLECRDAISAGSWSKTGGRTNVYQASISFTPALDAAEMHVWEDGSILTKVADQATCDSTAGSFVTVNIATSPQTLYIHASDSSNPGANGKVYLHRSRGYGIGPNTTTNTTVSGIKVSGNLHGGGGIQGLTGSTFTDCELVWGASHNMYVGENSSVVNCTFTDAAHSTSNSMLVANGDTLTGGTVAVTGCTFQMTSQSSYGAAAVSPFFSHSNVTGSFGVISFTNCTFTNLINSGLLCSTGATAINITNPTYTNCKYGQTPSTTTPVTVTGGSWSSNIANQRYMNASSNAGTVTIDGMTIYADQVTDTAYIHVATACTLVLDSVLFVNRFATGNRIPLYVSNASANVTIGGAADTGCTFNSGSYGWDYHFYFTAGASGFALVSDYNAFELTGERWYIYGTTYSTLATYQAAVAPNDANSTST